MTIMDENTTLAAAEGEVAATDGEVSVSGNVGELAPVQTAETATDPLALQRRALASRLMSEHGQIIARPVADWGLLAEGDDIAGHMLLVDLDTLQKVHAHPGSRVPAGRLFCNARNLPTAVVESL